MEYLIQCADRSYCVIYERSIIFENDAALDEGDSVRFLWPEDSPNEAAIYAGVIIQKNSKKNQFKNFYL